jgi:beta-glucosidase/6-phospho-beta-glucosidase/beta-galactosidase
MFPSFFLGGFECTAGYNRHGRWIDQVEATGHDRQLRADYRRLAAAGMRAAREGVRWPLVDRGGRYDLTTVDPLLEAAVDEDVVLLYDLFHFGYPERFDPFELEFADHFADYAFAVARRVRERTPPPHVFTPINEPSYFAWAAGEVGRFAPHARGRGPELKVALARAAIRAIDAIRAACPGARIVNVDPICRVVPPLDRPHLGRDAAAFNAGAVFESWDMLCGRRQPELGGSRSHLDVIGVNYYWTNQWEMGREGTPLEETDSRWAPLRDLLGGIHARYGGDLLITETSHVGDRRASWLRAVAAEAEALLDAGVPLRGICLYPVLGMPEWHDVEVWTRMGLWDIDERHRDLPRIPYGPGLAALRDAQARLEGRQWGARR